MNPSQEHRLRRFRQYGTLFGQAIGDALGVRDEFKHPAVIAKSGRDLLQYVPSSRNGDAEFKAGEWSDDTEQALCILQAYVDDGEIVPTTLAKHFLKWLECDGRGCGSHTMLLLNDPVFALDPIAVSQAAWEDSGRNAAANGAVMRASVVGTLRPDDIDWTEKTAALTAQVTHYDPRCVASAVAVADAVAALVRGRTIADAFAHAIFIAEKYHPEAKEYMTMSLPELKLAEGLVPGVWNTKVPIGYTYKALGAGFWSLREMERTGGDFGQCLLPILSAGGDVDTNAAVAGALLGAAVGLPNIPTHLLLGIHNRSRLTDLATKAFG